MHGIQGPQVIWTFSHVGLMRLFANNGWAKIVSARDHDASVVKTRSQLIASRVRNIALCFAFLTVAWIGIDAAAFGREVWVLLALGRLVAGLAFAAIALLKPDPHDPHAVYCRLGALFAVPVCFFIYSMGILGSSASPAMPVLLTTAYLYLPFIVVTGLAIFPLTFQENLVLGGSLLAVFAVVMINLASPAPEPSLAPLSGPVLPGLLSLSMLWPIILVSGVATISGMIQLQFLVAATEQAARDGLTRLYTRRAGEQLLKLLFQIAERSGAELSAVFIDLDLFKSVNDRYGHDAGDTVLRTAARSLAATLRRQDVAIRWGGEEFLVLLPNTGVEAAQSTMARIAQAGLGLRPDGTCQTASVGLAERRCDAATDELKLIGIADERMYAAKAAGRNCVVGTDGKTEPFLTKCDRPPKGGAQRTSNRKGTIVRRQPHLPRTLSSGRGTRLTPS